jgi:hypothetical protein
MRLENTRPLLRAWHEDHERSTRPAIKKSAKPSPKLSTVDSSSQNGKPSTQFGSGPGQHPVGISRAPITSETANPTKHAEESQRSHRAVRARVISRIATSIGRSTEVLNGVHETPTGAGAPHPAPQT